MPFGVSLVRALFFLAPGLVALDLVSGTARDLLPFNPLTGLFETFRDTLLYGQSPAAWQLLVPLRRRGRDPRDRATRSTVASSRSWRS